MKTLPLLAVLLSTLTISPTFAGAGSSGGGDANSKQIRRIRGYFTDNHTQLTTSLVSATTAVTKFPPVGEMSSQISDLVSKGIIDDIKEVKYELKTICTDENNIERSASTLKIDLSQNPEQERPVICVNVRKLAAEDASYESIVGLLLHEHARHYGLEDTDSLSLNPLADYVTERLSHFEKIAGATSVNEVVVVNEGFYVNIYTALENYNAKVVIDEINGRCAGLMSRDANGVKEISVGMSIALPKVADDLRWPFSGTRFEFYLKGTLFDKSVAAFGLYDRACEVIYHIQSGDKASSKMTAELHSNRWSIRKNNLTSIQVRFFSPLKDLE